MTDIEQLSDAFNAISSVFGKTKQTLETTDK